MWKHVWKTFNIQSLKKAFIINYSNPIDYLYLKHLDEKTLKNLKLYLTLLFALINSTTSEPQFHPWTRWTDKSNPVQERTQTFFHTKPRIPTKDCNWTDTINWEDTPVQLRQSNKHVAIKIEEVLHKKKKKNATKEANKSHYDQWAENRTQKFITNTIIVQKWSSADNGSCQLLSNSTTLFVHEKCMWED